MKGPDGPLAGRRYLKSSISELREARALNLPASSRARNWNYQLMGGRQGQERPNRLEVGEGGVA